MDEWMTHAPDTGAWIEWMSITMAQSYDHLISTMRNPYAGKMTSLYRISPLVTGSPKHKTLSIDVALWSLYDMIQYDINILWCVISMPPPLGAGGIMFSGCPSIRPSVRLSVCPSREVSGHFPENAWREWSEILHECVSWAPSELIRLWSWSADFPFQSRDIVKNLVSLYTDVELPSPVVNQLGWGTIVRYGLYCAHAR